MNFTSFVMETLKVLYKEEKLTEDELELLMNYLAKNPETTMNQLSEVLNILRCQHDSSENGICIDCGEEIDWVERVFRNNGDQ